MPAASFSVEVIRGVPVVAAPGEIDATNADGLQRALFEASMQGHGSFVVDMTRTRFCDSAGIHAMLRAHRRGDKVRLVVASDPIRRILEITGIDSVIPNFTSLDEALAQTPNGSGSP